MLVSWLSGECGADAVAGEPVVEDVDAGAPVIRGELVELGEPFAEQSTGAEGGAVDEQ